MTWVVGATTMFGYGVIVSDICVSRGKLQYDVLRKAYPVGRFIVAGFSGSVRIGFDLLTDLKHFLKMTEEEELDNECWQPAWVAENWPQRASSIFASAPEAARQQNAAILMVGVDPHENRLGGGLPVVSALRSPDFRPIIEQGSANVMGIGSGARRPEVMELLRKNVTNIDMLQAEVGSPGAFGQFIASGMTHNLFHGAPPGVSRHLHVTIVGINRLVTYSNDTTYYPPGGTLVELRMPKIAESYAEMSQMLNLSADAGNEVVA